MVPPWLGEILEWSGWATGGRCCAPAGMMAMVMAVTMVAAVMVVSHAGVGCCSPVGEGRGTAEGKDVTPLARGTVCCPLKTSWQGKARARRHVPVGKCSWGRLFGQKETGGGSRWTRNAGEGFASSLKLFV